MTDMKAKVSNPLGTLRAADKAARELGLKRGAGTYNGRAYWKNTGGQIVTCERLEYLAGYGSHDDGKEA